MRSVRLTNDLWPPVLRTCLSPFLADGQKGAAVGDARTALAASDVVDFLDRHKLLAFAGREFCRLGAKDLTPAFQARWIFRHAQALHRSRQLRAVLAGLADCAREAGIPLLNLRTPYLVELAYGGDYGARGFQDIDLAVPPKYVGDYMKCVARRFGDVRLEQSRYEEARLKVDLGSRLEFRVQDVPVDLHWDLTLLYNFQRSPKIAVRQERIWARVDERELPWGAMFVLHDVDLLLHLAEHLVIQHDLRSRSYRGVLDFARAFVLVTERVDVGQLMDAARERGTSTALQAAALAAEALFQAPEESPLVRLARSAGAAVASRVDYQLRQSPPSMQHKRLVSGWRRTAASLEDTVRNLQTTAAFMDECRNRWSFLQTILFPGRRVLSYACGRTLRWHEWLLYLLAHPFLLPLAVPAVGTLLSRQWEETWTSLLDWRRRGRLPEPAAISTAEGAENGGFGRETWVLDKQLAEVLKTIRKGRAA